MESNWPPFEVEEFLGTPVFSIELVDRWRASHSRGVEAFDQVQVAYKLRTAFWCLDFTRQNFIGIAGSIPPTSIRGRVPR